MMGRERSDAALDGGMDTLSLQGGLEVMRQLQENELRFQQQLRKSGAPATQEQGEKPVW